METQHSMRRRDFIKLTGTTLFGATVLAACGGGPTSSGGPEPVSIWAWGYNGNISNWSADPILQAIEKATNTKISISFFAVDTFTNKVNAAIASGQPPDIIGAVSNQSLVAKWAHDGAIAPFEGDVAAAAPHIVNAYKTNKSLSELEINGKIYVDPVQWDNGTYPNMGIVHVRKDLLDKYGMQPPDTFDQYLAFVRASKKDGSTGIIFGTKPSTLAVFNVFLGAFGVPYTGWVKKETGFEFWAIQPGTKEALLMFRSIVAEGLIDTASWELTGDDARSKFVAGEGSSLIFNGGGHIGRIQNDMDLVSKGYKEWLLPALDAGKGSRGYTSEPQFYGVAAIGGASSNHATAAARVMNFLDSDAGYKLTVLGIEGRDYKMENGQIKLIPEQRVKDGFPSEQGGTGAHPLATSIVTWVPQSWQDFSLLYGKDDAFKTWYKQMWDNQGKYQIPAYGISLVTPSWVSFQPTSDDLTNSTFTQIVQSKSESAAASLFDQFVNDWKSRGGDTATAEMSAALSKLHY